MLGKSSTEYNVSSALRVNYFVTYRPPTGSSTPIIAQASQYGNALKQIGNLTYTGALILARAAHKKAPAALQEMVT
jgi:hypothetical protein